MLLLCRSPTSWPLSALCRSVVVVALFPSASLRSRRATRFVVAIVFVYIPERARSEEEKKDLIL